MQARAAALVASFIFIAGCWTDAAPTDLEAVPDPVVAAAAPAPPPPTPPPTIENAFSCGTVGEVGYVPVARDMQLFPLPTGTFPNAVCNDGTPAILYFRPGRGAGLTHWLIELEGGGGCRTAQECADRYCSDATNFGRQQMGSADYIATVPWMAATGIQSITIGSPYFDYNHVFVHYCSSDGWAGNSTLATGTALAPPAHTAPVTFSTRFNGNAILNAVIRVLRQDGAVLPPFTLTGTPIPMPDLDDATGNVVIAGGSAGGIGVELQLDRTVTNLIANHNPALPLPFYSGMIDSAFAPQLQGLGFQFTDVCLTLGACDWRSYINANAPYYPKLTDASCTAMHAGTNQAFRCSDPTHVVRNHITTPMFLRQGENDSLLSDHYQNREKLATSPAATATMTVAEFEGLVRVQAEGVPTWNAIAEEPPGRIPGVFAPDCPTHDPLRSSPAFLMTSIGGWTWGQIWDNWRNLASPRVEVSDPAIPGTASICF